MANYHKRNSIRAVQWDPENAQSLKHLQFEGFRRSPIDCLDVLLSAALDR